MFRDEKILPPASNVQSWVKSTVEHSEWPWVILTECCAGLTWFNQLT